jgi:hypothetical protein
VTVTRGFSALTMNIYREYYERHKTALHFQCSRKEYHNENHTRKQLAINKSVRSLTLQSADVTPGSPATAPTDNPATPTSSTDIHGVVNTSTDTNGVRSSLILDPKHASDTHFEAMTYKPIMDADKLMNEVITCITHSASSPAEKHVHILLKSSALARFLGGTVGILCKSG